MKKYLFIALMAFLAVTSASAQLRIKMGKNSPIEKLGRAEIAITNLYVDSVDENKLVEDAIRGMLEKLDPHSSYATAKETKAMNEPLNGSFDGIGVLCMTTPLVSLVAQLTPGRPAAQIANMHTIFNIGTTLLLLPAGNLLAGMAEHLLPDKKSESLAAEQRKAACKKVEDVWNS